MKGHELVFAIPDTEPKVRVSSVGVLHVEYDIRPMANQNVGFRPLRFNCIPIAGWLLHSLCVAGEEQLLVGTGVPIQLLTGDGEIHMPKVFNGRVSLELSHTLNRPHAARITIGVLLC